MARIDPRCATWVQAHDGVQAKVESVGYMDGFQTKGKLGIYVFAMYRKVLVWCYPFKMVLPGSEDDFATLPELVTDMSGGGFMPDRGERGPFKIVCGDAAVDGMGLPANNHVIYVVQFQLLVAPK